MVVTSTTKDNGKSDNTNPYYDGTSSIVTDIDSIRITEVEQHWRRGVAQVEPVNFNTTCGTILMDGDDVIWGTVEKEDGDTVNNGKQIADMEYFCLAERGDVFRNMGWPNNIDVKYMVDPSKEYDMLDLHYFFSGDGVQVHKSEKDLTIVADNPTVMEALKTALTGIGVTVQ